MINAINYHKTFKDFKLIGELQEFLDKLLNDFNRTNCIVNLVFCDNEFIQNLNREYRGIDKPTDVLSFSQIEEMEDDTPFLCDTIADHPFELGDIIISIEKAISQADEYTVTLEEEIARLAVHGTLHLLGFDHETSEEDEKEMLAKQDEYLDNFIQKYRQ